MIRSTEGTETMRTLTAIGVTFGLLLSSAFAQEKSAEQLREERNRIWSVEGQQSDSLTRVVASGAKLRVGFWRAVNPDCSSMGAVTIRITKQPEHGKVEIAAASEYASYPKENIRSRCNHHRVKGTLATYKSAEKYTGDDEFDLLVLLPGGFAQEIHYNISVR
jgi:hypothetical protein